MHTNKPSEQRMLICLLSHNMFRSFHSPIIKAKTQVPKLELC